MNNINLKTGIHYGVIAQNSLYQDAFQEIFDEATDLNHEEYIETIKDEIRGLLEDKVSPRKIDGLCDEVFDVIEQDVNEDSQGEKIDWEFSDKEYKLANCLETNVFVINSPYFTFCRKCSPCVPGAGDLDNPEDGGLKTYCLGPEFFDDEKAPYAVYVVKTGELL